MNHMPQCIPLCQLFIGGEIKHHPGCPFYPESLSKMFDELRAQAGPFTRENVESAFFAGFIISKLREGNAELATEKYMNENYPFE